MEQKALPEVCHIQYGYPFDSKRFSDKEGFPLIRIRDVVRGHTETFTTESCNDEYIVKKGDILIGMDGMFNVAKWKGNTAYLNQRVCKIEPNSSIVADYLFYYLPCALKKIENKTAFVTVKHLKAKQLNSILIPYPPVKEQKRIAQILDLLFYLICQKKKQLNYLDELVKSRFIEMFGHSDRPKVRLGECCIINPKKSSDIRLVDNDLMVSFVSMSDVSEDGQIVTCNHKQYESVKSGFTYFSENDVLFAKITPCMENGKGGIAKGLLNGIGFGSTEFHVLRPIDQVSNSCWLYELTSFPQFRQAAEINMTGSAGQRRVPASFLANYKVSLPPISLQNQFADFVHQLDKSKLAVQKSLDELEILKKSLMQTYFG